LILKVAQPQVPLSKKLEMGKAHFCVCPHTTKLETRENKMRVVVTVAETKWWWWYSDVEVW
jgi:hypothetical protein